ncbi:unnamed protein product [Parajaminaea phylloscopi]
MTHPPRAQTRAHDEHLEHGHAAGSPTATRFTLWETKAHFYLVAYNTAQTCFRVLKVDRSPAGHQASPSPSPSTSADDGPAEAATAPTTLAFGSTPSNQHPAADRGNSGPGAAAKAARDANVADPASKAASTEKSPPAPLRPTPAAAPPDPGSAAFWGLGVTVDKTTYDRTQITEILDMVSDGNRANGGLKEVGHFFGLVGFIRFTSTYHMVLISRRSVVALIGGHYIYHCDETKIIPVCHPAFTAAVPGRTKALDQEEARLLHTFKQVDLGKNFYFSYTYDLTRTLQENLTGRRFEQRDTAARHTAWGFTEKFIWNHHLLLPAFGGSEAQAGGQVPQHDWVLPLCYGFVDQAKLSVLSRTIHVTLIARRSRHFAGARFLKRGANEAGQVANDVETEQIVSEALTTPFYAPHDAAGESAAEPEEHQSLAQNPRFTSYVMHRGSIPISWTQDSTNMSPRPPIEISVVDPYYSSAALHFDELLARYGPPVIILNLIKSKEKTPRETKLLHAFGECVSYLNQFLPADKKMVYVAWDMSRASKSHDQDVIGVLEDIAEETIEKTRFFHSGPEPTRFAFVPMQNGFADDDTEPATTSSARRCGILMQTGVARVNCVDCLDRTNAAQFVIGKAAFGHQLHALGLLEHPSLPFDSDAVDMLTEMYHDLGDTVALQYGGSHLVNTMETYRKINQWTSHSRDMLEGLKRYYANSFVDADKQAAINLFLGIDENSVAPNGVGRSSGSRLAVTSKSLRNRRRRDYQHWYTPANLGFIEPTPERVARLLDFVRREHNFWAEYYRPRLFTDFMRHHAFKMTAVLQRLSHQQRSQIQPHDGYRLPQSPSKRHHHGKKESVSSLPTIPSAPGSPTGTGSSATTAVGRASAASDGKATVAWPVVQDTSTLVTSPFTSRFPRSRARSNSRPRIMRRLRTSSASSSVSVASSAAAATATESTEPATWSSSFAGPADAKALVGGVRRWMSLNHQGEVPDAAANGQRRRVTISVGSGEASKGPETEKDDRSITLSAGATNPGPEPIGHWLNPFVPSSQTHPSASLLLRDWRNPTVAAEEAREYSLWVHQFRGNISLQPQEPMWDALLTEPAALRTEEVHSNDAHLSDTDLQLYFKTVRRATTGGVADLRGGGPHVPTNEALAGGAAAVPIQPPSERLVSGPAAVAMHHANSLANCAGPQNPSGGGDAGVDPVLLNYAALASGGNAALGMHVGIKGASESKVRAYRSWLNVGKRGV